MRVVHQPATSSNFSLGLRWAGAEHQAKPSPHLAQLRMTALAESHRNVSYVVALARGAESARPAPEYEALFCRTLVYSKRAGPPFATASGCSPLNQVAQVDHIGPRVTVNQRAHHQSRLTGASVTVVGFPPGVGNGLNVD